MNSKSCRLGFAIGTLTLLGPLSLTGCDGNSGTGGNGASGGDTESASSLVANACGDTAATAAVHAALDSRTFPTSMGDEIVTVQSPKLAQEGTSQTCTFELYIDGEYEGNELRIIAASSAYELSNSSEVNAGDLTCKYAGFLSCEIGDHALEIEFKPAYWTLDGAGWKSLYVEILDAVQA